jgi:hypothetical protein
MTVTRSSGKIDLEALASVVQSDPHYSTVAKHSVISMSVSKLLMKARITVQQSPLAALAEVLLSSGSNWSMKFISILLCARVTGEVLRSARLNAVQSSQPIGALEKSQARIRAGLIFMNTRPMLSLTIWLSRASVDETILRKLSPVVPTAPSRACNR